MELHRKREAFGERVRGSQEAFGESVRGSQFERKERTKVPDDQRGRCEGPVRPCENDGTFKSEQEYTSNSRLCYLSLTQMGKLSQSQVAAASQRHHP